MSAHALAEELARRWWDERKISYNWTDSDTEELAKLFERAEAAETQAQLMADRLNDMIASVAIYVEYVKVCESRRHNPGEFSDWYACSPPDNRPPSTCNK